MCILIRSVEPNDHIPHYWQWSSHTLRINTCIFPIDSNFFLSRCMMTTSQLTSRSNRSFNTFSFDLGIIRYLKNKNKNIIRIHRYKWTTVLKSQTNVKNECIDLFISFSCSSNTEYTILVWFQNFKFIHLLVSLH